MKTLKQTIAAMLTQNTGTHALDSGGEYGRNWQRNAGMTCEDFDAQPSATLWLDLNNWHGKPQVYTELTVNIWHKLTSGVLELNEVCRQFNALDVDDWGSVLNGVSNSGEEWLADRGFVWDDRSSGFNTYNWDNFFSQVIQGNFIMLDGEYGVEKYVLLQIHGGADVRGGYTDAKLFKLCDHAEEYDLFRDDCGFSVETKDGDHLYLSWSGQWINADGGSADDDDFMAFALAAGAVEGEKSVSVEGDQYNDV